MSRSETQKRIYEGLGAIRAALPAQDEDLLVDLVQQLERGIRQDVLAQEGNPTTTALTLDRWIQIEVSEG